METLACAKILSSYGIKGELKIKSLSGEVDHFYKMKEVYIERQGRLETYVIESVKEMQNVLLVKLGGIDDPEHAKELQGHEIRVSRSMSCPVRENEYYFTDLVDCSVMKESGEIGKVKSIIETGGRCILEISDITGGTSMIPFMKRFIKEVDIASHRVILSEEANIF